jgi:hypothetical protein
VGERVIVLGGFASDPCPPGAACVPPAQPPLSNGAAFDPGTNAWERIAQAPVPIGWGSGAVVGDTLYLWVGASESHPAARPAFLAYSPTQNRWDELPMPEIGEDHPYALAASGERVVAYQSTQELEVRSDFEFDPSARSWTELPADPLAPSFDRTMVGTDAGLVLLGIENVPQPGSSGPAVYRAAVLDPSTGKWRRLPDSEVAGYDPSWFWTGGVVVNPTLGTSDGGDVNAWERPYPHGGILDPVRGTWAPLPDPPAPAESFPHMAAGGSGYVSSFSGWALHVPSGRWVELAPPPETADEGQAITWAGDHLFVWGGVRWDGEGTILDGGWLWSPAAPPESESASTVDIARIVCQADGTTSVLTPEVVARPDGVHLVVDNRLGEPASLIGGFGFDVDPGISKWTLQTGPGDRGVACWPFSDHGGKEPGTVPLRVLDPEGLYVPPAELECQGSLQWSEIRDFIDLSSGIDADPAETVRRSIRGFEPGDVVSEHRSGYPEAQDEGTTTVTVSRDGRIVAIFGLSVADDSRWLVNGGQGCASVTIT